MAFFVSAWGNDTRSKIATTTERKERRKSNGEYKTVRPSLSQYSASDKEQPPCKQGKKKGNSKGQKREKLRENLGGKRPQTLGGILAGCGLWSSDGEEVKRPCNERQA